MDKCRKCGRETFTHRARLKKLRIADVRNMGPAAFSATIGNDCCIDTDDEKCLRTQLSSANTRIAEMDDALQATGLLLNQAKSDLAEEREARRVAEEALRLACTTALCVLCPESSDRCYVLKEFVGACDTEDADSRAEYVERALIARAEAQKGETDGD